MNCLVTGAAGFIGSHICRRLLKEGFYVTGIDSFTSFYPKWIKERNIQPFLNEKKFEFIAEDINTLSLKKLLQKADYVFHIAAQAGVRSSWGQEFSAYTKNNIEATQKLLEESKEAQINKFIYASSSSVYGFRPELPTSEDSSLLPYSPYGVTKLAGENLCFLYFKNYGVPCISLRFFTVYGPGQRPDMAFHRFFKAIAENRPISIYGNGEQTRDFTYINDIIEANFASIKLGKIGETYNIGGGNRRKIIDLFPIFEETCKQKVQINWQENQRGDVLHTFASIEKAKRDLNYTPKFKLYDGLQEEFKWIKSLYSI